MLLLSLAMQSPAAEWRTDILHDTFGYVDDPASDAPLSEVQQGCGVRDCVPAIDHTRTGRTGRACRPGLRRTPAMW